MGSLEGNLNRTIFDLGIGEEAWAYKEALEIHYEYDKHFLFLDEEISEDYDPKGKYILHVKRIGPRKDDFIVNLNKSKDYCAKRTFIEKEDYLELIEEKGIALLDHKGIIKKRIKGKGSLEEKLEKALRNEEYEKAGQLKRSKEN